MNKIVRVKLLSSEVNLDYEVKCIYNAKTQEIKYIDQDEEKTIVKFSFLDYTLARKNNNMRLRYHFVENEITEGELDVTGIPNTIKVDVETKKIEKKENMINIVYFVDNTRFNYILEVL